jgi:hypothetical protein
VNSTEHPALPEPPPNPLVLRAPGSGKGINRERGPIIKRYERTETTRRLEAEVRELNNFLARCDIRRGENHGFRRNFNLASWRKGGRRTVTIIRIADAMQTSEWVRNPAGRP